VALEKSQQMPVREITAVIAFLIHRKYALRLLSAPFRRAQKPSCKLGPISCYDTPEMVVALRTIWLASDQLCSKRVKAAQPLWLPAYATSFQPLSS